MKKILNVLYAFLKQNHKFSSHVVTIVFVLHVLNTQKIDVRFVGLIY